MLALFFSRTNLGLAILERPARTPWRRARRDQRPAALSFRGRWQPAGQVGRRSSPRRSQGNFSPGALTFGVIPGFTAAVLGGMNSLPGAFVGGTIVGIAQSVAVTADLTSGIPGAAAVAVFVLLLVVLIVRPQGLLGRT